MRDHFDDAAGAGARGDRLHVFFSCRSRPGISRHLPASSALIGATIGIAGSLLLYKFTYGHPELRIPGMAIALFLGMYLSRVFVLGPLGFIIGFIVAVSQSVGEEVPSPELLVRGTSVALGSHRLRGRDHSRVAPVSCRNPRSQAEHRPMPRSLFVPDAFTNPAHVQFALKVTFAAMFCYIVYEAIDWSGIHTAFITCTFIALESTEATLYKGTSESSVV